MRPTHEQEVVNEKTRDTLNLLKGSERNDSFESAAAQPQVSHAQIASPGRAQAERAGASLERVPSPRGPRQPPRQSPSPPLDSSAHILTGGIMAKTCDICGKGVQFGQNVSHANNVTKRRWEVNL